MIQARFRGISCRRAYRKQLDEIDDDRTGLPANTHAVECGQEGNCAVLSIVRSLAERGVTTTSRGLRWAIQAWRMGRLREQFGAKYASFLFDQIRREGPKESDMNTDLDIRMVEGVMAVASNYIARMARDGEWWGRLELADVARYLRRTVVVYQDDAEPQAFPGGSNAPAVRL